MPRYILAVVKRLYSQIVGQPVYLRGDGAVAIVFDVIFDPENGKMIALSTAPRLRNVVPVSDVLSYFPRVVVRDENSIGPPDEVVRIATVLKKRYSPVYKAKVVTETGRELGRVHDILIDVDSEQLAKIYVARAFLGIVQFGNRIFSWKHILRIESDRIVVRDDNATERVRRASETNESVPIPMEIGAMS